MKRLATLLAFQYISLVALSATALSGQTITGSIGGAVFDPSNEVLPGVTLELSGPALPGGRIAVTSADGMYRFRNVPPGEQYTIKISLEGFRGVNRGGIEVFLGRDVVMNFTLSPELSETITVVGESPMVDATNTSAGLNITARQFESLPSVRSFQRLTAMAPGVSFVDTEVNSLLESSPSVGSASPLESNFLVDGMSTTGIFFGTSDANVPTNFIAEVQVMTGGYSAEYGRSMGGVFNVVTKSGGNDVSGDVFGYLQNSDWASNAIRREFQGTATRENGTDRNDIGMSIGGPIAQDRLWFFTAIDRVRHTTHQNAFESASGALYEEPHDYESPGDIYAAKLTWAVSRPQTLVASFFSNPNRDEGWLGGPRSDPTAALRRLKYQRRQASLSWNREMRPWLFLETSAGRYEEKTDAAALTELGRVVPRQFDATTSWYHGGNVARTDVTGPRDTIFAKSTIVARSHELRLGADLERRAETGTRSDYSFTYYGKRRISPALGMRDLMMEYIENTDASGTNSQSAFFVEDRWSIRPNIQLNLGLRYERQQLDSATAIHQATGFTADGRLAYTPVDRVDLGNDIAPRLGVIWDPLRSGKSRVFLSAGRFFEAIPLWINVAALDGLTRTMNYYYALSPVDSATWYNPNGSPLNGNWVLARTNQWDRDSAVFAVDNRLRTPYQDEITLGFEQQFRGDWVAGVRLVDRRIGRTIEDFSVYADLSDLSTVSDYVIGNPGTGSFGRHLDAPSRHYNALELTLQRAFRDRWQVIASVLSARSRGNYEGLYDASIRQLSPNLTASYDFPAFGVNADGRLSSDVPYQFKLYGSYAWPFGLSLSEGFLYSAGRPVSKLGPDLHGGGMDGLINLVERGSAGRTPDYWNLDLHADYRLPINVNGVGAKLVIDVFNATDNHGVLSVDENYIYLGMDGFDLWKDPSNLDQYGNPRFNADLPASPYWNTPRVYQAPRTVQVGLRVTY